MFSLSNNSQQINLLKSGINDFKNQGLKIEKKYMQSERADKEATLLDEYLNSNTFGNDIKKENLFLISNYCFSEIESHLQQKYIDILFPKILHGFMIWNLIPFFNFGFETEIKVEIPCTGGGNKYIYF